jgi:hypothetical protein
MTTAVKIGIDGFPINAQHLYAEQHLAIDPIIEQALQVEDSVMIEIDKNSLAYTLTKQKYQLKISTIFAIFERLDWLEKEVWPEFYPTLYTQYRYTTSLAKNVTILSKLLNKLIGGMDYTESDLMTMLSWCIVNYMQRVQQLNPYGLNLPLNRIINYIEKFSISHPLSEDFRYLIYQSYALGVAQNKIDQILRDRSKKIKPGQLFNLNSGTHWADIAVQQIELLQPTEIDEWTDLLVHSSIATQAIPTSKWLATAQSILNKVGINNFKNLVSNWFKIVDGSSELPISDRNRLVLTGLIWFYSLLGDEIELVLQRLLNE